MRSNFTFLDALNEYMIGETINWVKNEVKHPFRTERFGGCHINIQKESEKTPIESSEA